MEKVALIIGTGGRQDSAFAQALADEGTYVELLVQGNADLPTPSDRVRCSALDIEDEDKISNAVQSIARNRGGIDFLITCPDFRLSRALLETTEEEWETCVALNLTSVFLACKHVVPVMAARRTGRIINITSDAGRMGAANGAAYAATKAGVITFSKALAREVAASGINVNVISTGMMEEGDPDLGDAGGFTDVLLKRPGSWEEVAYIMSCLLNDRASYLTGQTIHVNGGLYMP
jgi:3-oxoacyl-[acyl-carrier protein] reductase